MTVDEPGPPARSASGRARVRAVLAVATTALILGALAYLVDVERAVALLAEADVLLLAASGLSFLAALVVRGARFQRVLNHLVRAEPPRVAHVGATGEGPPTHAPAEPLSFAAGFDLAALNNIGNHLLPLRMGELAFVFLAAGQHRVPADRALLGLLFCRLGDLLGMCIVLAGGAAFAPSYLDDGARLALGAAFVAVATAAVFFAPLASFGCRVLLRALGPLQGTKIGKKAHAVTDKLLTAVPLFADRRLGGMNVLLSVLIWCAVMGCFWCVMRGLHLELSVGEVVLGSAGAALLPLAPVNVLGTIGPLEAGWAAGFIAVGLSRSDAVTSGVVMHALVIAISGIAAAFSLPRVGSDVLPKFIAWWRTKSPR